MTQNYYFNRSKQQDGEIYILRFSSPTVFDTVSIYNTFRIVESTFLISKVQKN